MPINSEFQNFMLTDIVNQKTEDAHYYVCTPFGWATGIRLSECIEKCKANIPTGLKRQKEYQNTGVWMAVFVVLLPEATNYEIQGYIPQVPEGKLIKVGEFNY